MLVIELIAHIRAHTRVIKIDRNHYRHRSSNVGGPSLLDSIQVKGDTAAGEEERDTAAGEADTQSDGDVAIDVLLGGRHCPPRQKSV